MVRSNKKAKPTGVDFKKVKHKVGRRLPPPKNATKVEVKSKAIILPEQSLAVEKKGLAVNRKQQTLKELLMQTIHHNANVRKDALYGIKDLFIRHPKEIKLHKLAIIEKLSPRISDADKGVRDSLFLLFKLAVFPGLEEVVMGPLIPITMAHIFNAMTQLAMNIRLMAFKFLDLVVEHYQSSVIANYSAKVLQHYVDILGKTGSFSEDKGNLMDILTGLVHYLTSLHLSTQPTNSSPDQGKSQLVTLHGYKCVVPQKVAAVGIMNIAGDDNPQYCSEGSETDPALSLGFGRYKVVTRIVSLCLSELGDETLVLGLIQPTIFQELAYKRPLDITCALLRVVVVLSSRSMQLPIQIIHDLPHYIYHYLMDISRGCMMNENGQESKFSCTYYILPCVFLFSRSEKLTSLVFGLLECSSSEGSESKSAQVKHLCAVSWVVIQLYKIERMHYRFAVCKSSTKVILKNINALQASLCMDISNEERERLMKFYSQLKVTTSAVHNWKEN